MWVVKIVQPIPTVKNDFRAGFFPRKVRYKEQAEALAREVAFKGGIADVGRVDKERVRSRRVRPVD